MKFLEKTLTKNQLLELSPLALAFVGDGVHTLFVRDEILKSKNLTTNSYNTLAIKKCKATYQASILDIIMPTLTEEEQNIVRRARNSKLGHQAKNSSMEDYKKATAYEALIGWLYLQGDYERMEKMLNIEK